MNGEDPQPVPRPRGKLSHLDIAKKLLREGADPERHDHLGRSPVQQRPGWRAARPT
jgi:hypothetical protein